MVSVRRSAGVRLPVWVTVCVSVAVAASIAPARGAEAPNSMELVLNNWGDAVFQAVEAGVARYEALHPGLTVDVTPRGSWDEMIVRIVAGAAPDVVAVGLGVGGMGEDGLFMPLDDRIDDDLRQSIVEEMWYNFTWQGHIYGVPAMEHGPRLGMVWNAELLAEAGLSVDPSQAMTWETFFNYTDRLTRVDGQGNVERMGYDPRNGQNSRLFTVAPIWGAAGYMQQDPPAINHANLAHMLELTADRVYRRYAGFTGTTSWYGIAQGQVAVSNLGIYAPGEIGSRNPDMDILLTWPPSFDGRRVQQVNGWALGIPEGAPDPERSFALIEFLATDVEFQLDLFRRTGFLGGGRAFLNQLAREVDDPSMRWYVNSLANAEFIDAPRPDPFMSTADSLFRNVMNQVYDLEGTAQPLLDEAQRVFLAELRQEGRL